jgi:flavin-dependent dehydrogenase
MKSCDVIIVGGGPGGSSCAWALRRHGLHVVVIDRASFPRDKVCAGWITPPVIRALELDTDDYANGRTFQPITGFRVGLLGSRPTDIRYGHAVSFGILRSEFDHYLLARSGAALFTGTPVTTLRRERDSWIVNDLLRAPMLVGAGGHFCPVSRQLNGLTPAARGWPVVVAQEVELPLGDDDEGFATDPATPELYFRPDLRGYGWCFRKGRHLNVGLGIEPETRGGEAADGSAALPAATGKFVEYLVSERRVPDGRRWRWKGHAYLLDTGRRRAVAGEAVLLVGDAAGLADARSGEGIRPAIESGLLAARVIVEAAGRYDPSRLAPYAEGLGRAMAPLVSDRRVPFLQVPLALRTVLGRAAFRVPPFVRHVVLDRWFLQRHAAL